MQNSLLKWPQIVWSYQYKMHLKFLRECLWNKHQGRASARIRKTAASSKEHFKISAKLSGIAEAGMRQKVWRSVKMYWALSQRVWTAARQATAASPDNSKYQEPVRTCGEVLGKHCISSNSCWLAPGAEQSCELQPYPPSPKLLNVTWGHHYFFHFDFSCQIRKWHEK